jgi:DNA-binding FadR family transcriptional regulator
MPARAARRPGRREAVKVLAAKGLLEPRPRIGTRVCPCEQWNQLDPDILAWRCATGADAEFLRHLTELREIIEPAAASLAANNRSEAQLAAIASALRASNTPLLMPLAAIVDIVLDSLLGVPAHPAGDFIRARPDHQKVLEAIQNGDAQSALHRMAGMLSDTRTRMKPALV